CTMVVGGRTADQYSGQTYFFFAPLLLPFFILGVPIVDTTFAIVRRVGRRAKVSEADKEHLHHRLMRLGHGPRRSALIPWPWTAAPAVSSGRHVVGAAEPRRSRAASGQAGDLLRHRRRAGPRLRAGVHAVPVRPGRPLPRRLAGHRPGAHGGPGGDRPGRHGGP